MGGQAMPSPMLIDDLNSLLIEGSYTFGANNENGIPVAHITKEEHKNLSPGIMEESFDYQAFRKKI